jgi:hypothetical protein
VTVTCPPPLRKLYHQGRLIPFVGAGISAGVRWQVDGVERRGPTWSELVDQAARQIGFADANLLRVRGTDLQILEYYRRKRHSSIGELSTWLSNHMQVPEEHLAGSSIHAGLAALTRCNRIYTTNYDDFIERALLLHGRECTKIVIEGHIADAQAHAAEAGGDTLCEVVKFHGDLTVPEKMVLSESDYERRLKLEDPLDHRLRSDVLGRALLFLGYSFRDWNIAYLFRLVEEAFGDLPASNGGRRAYIVMANPCDFEITLFDARNIEVVPIDGNRTSEEIATLLGQLLEPSLV